MIKINFKNGVKKEIPESWDETPFLQFVGLSELNKADDKTVVAFMTGLDVSVINRMSVIEYGKLVSALAFTNKDIEKRKPIYYSKDLGLDEVQKFEEMCTYSNKPIIEQVYASFRIYLDKEGWEVNEMPTSEVIRQHAFFLKKLKEYERGMIRGSILYRMMRMLKVQALKTYRAIGDFFTR
jgi:hypothetical protein